MQSNLDIAPLFVHRSLWQYVEGGGKQILHSRKSLFTYFYGRSVRVALSQYLAAVGKAAKKELFRTTALDDSCQTTIFHEIQSNANFIFMSFS